MEIIETIRLATERITPSSVIITMIFGFITGYFFVGKFGMSLKQMILSSILTMILFTILVIDASVHAEISDGSPRTTNGVAALLLYLLFLACSSFGAKAESELGQ